MGEGDAGGFAEKTHNYLFKIPRNPPFKKGGSYIKMQFKRRLVFSTLLSPTGS
jgi:hypothetical protein